MEEQLMFTRVHEALDTPMPPGAYERLRSELTNKPVRPFRWPALKMRYSSMGFRLAAGLVVVAIAVAAAAAAVAIHNSTNSVTPAGSRMSIQAYQKMINQDSPDPVVVYSAPCGSGNDSGCSADAARGIPLIQKWLDDISRSDIPLRFVVINSEMRQVLIQNIAAQKDLLAASQAHDGPGIDRAFTLAVYAPDWTGTVLPGIAASKQVDAGVYRGSVLAAVVALNSCVSNFCSMLVSPEARTCTTNGGASCLQMFDEVAVKFIAFSTALVQDAAPESLSTVDIRLQNDLAAAGAVLRTLRAAVANNDQAGINSGLDQLIRLVPRIDADAGKITG